MEHLLVIWEVCGVQNTELHFAFLFTNLCLHCHNEFIYLLQVLSKELFSFCRHLPEKIKDDQQLKNMSGQWFYEAKAKRHREKIHGADIIRASMRKKRLPVAGKVTGCVPIASISLGRRNGEGCQNH